MGSRAALDIFRVGGIYGPGRSPFISMPAGNGFLFGNPRYDWGFTSVPQPGLGGRSITRVVAFNAVPHLERAGRAHAGTYS